MDHRLRWSTHQASAVRVGGGVLEPPTFSGNPGEISSPAAKSWGSSAGNSGKIWDSDGIVRGCTNYDRRRGRISVT